MVLEISGERRSDYAGGDSDAFYSVLPNRFLRFVWKGLDPTVQRVVIEGNRISYDLRSGEKGVVGPKTSKIEVLSDYRLPLAVSYSANGEGRSGRLSLSLDLERGYDFVFESDNGLNELVDGIFGTRRFGHKSTTLETVGLPASNELEIELEYQTPLFVWRGLPDELVEKLVGFRLKGPYLMVSVDPDKSGDNRLGVKVDPEGFSIPTSRKERVEKRFGKYLTETGLVKFVEETEGGRRLSCYTIQRDRILSRKGLETLEEIVKIIVPEANKLKKSWGTLNEATLDFKGSVPRDVFYLVPNIIDNSEECKVNGSVKSGNISVWCVRHEYPRKTRVTLSDANIEDAENLIRVGSDHGNWKGRLGNCALSIKESGAPSKDAIDISERS